MRRCGAGVLGEANSRLSGNGERQKDWSILPSPTVLPTVEFLTLRLNNMKNKTPTNPTTSEAAGESSKTAEDVAEEVCRISLLSVQVRSDMSVTRV